MTLSQPARLARYGSLVGAAGLLLPYLVWAIFAGWMLLGLAMYAWSRATYGVDYSDRMINRELT